MRSPEVEGRHLEAVAFDEGEAVTEAGIDVVGGLVRIARIGDHVGVAHPAPGGGVGIEARRVPVGKRCPRPHACDRVRRALLGRHGHEAMLIAGHRFVDRDLEEDRVCVRHALNRETA